MTRPDEFAEDEVLASVKKRISVMDRLEELKTKYQPALGPISEGATRRGHMRVQNNKPFLQSAAPNEDIKNFVWNRMKKIVQRFHGSDLFQRIIEALKVPAA
jgi:hypothetical protein